VLQAKPAGASTGVDCSKINVPSLMMQDNLRAGLILVECGIVPGGKKTPGGVAEHTPANPPNIKNAWVSNDKSCSSASDLCGSESMVAASTADQGQTIVVNYNANYDNGEYSGTSYSTNGGATFTENNPFNSGHGTNYGDPLVVYNSKLALFFAGDLVDGGCSGGLGIGLWTSPDGKTWTTGSCPSTGTNDDRPSMWADNEPSSGTYGRMYISFNDFNNGGALDVVYSDDGKTWTGPVVVSNTGTFMRDVQITGSPRGSTITKGDNATVFLAGMDEGGGGNATRQNYMFNSTNGGKTWNTVTVGKRFNPPGDSACPGNSYFWQVNPIIRHMGWGQPAVGPNGVVHYDYAGAGTGQDHGDIFYTQSTDNGKTWSTPIKLNTDKDKAYRTQWMPSLSATSDGNVTATWYDRSQATSMCTNVGDKGCNYNRMARQSSNNGSSWNAEIKVSSKLITQPAQDDSGVVGCYAGDYDYSSALNATDAGNGTGTAYTTWTDGRHAISGTHVQNVDFAAVPEP
jgi:hypothetical protein